MESPDGDGLGPSGRTGRPVQVQTSQMVVILKEKQENEDPRQTCGKTGEKVKLENDQPLTQRGPRSYNTMVRRCFASGSRVSLHIFGPTHVTPRRSMSVIYAYIDPSNHPNVGKYAIHGVSGTVTVTSCHSVFLRDELVACRRFNPCSPSASGWNDDDRATKTALSSVLSAEQSWQSCFSLQFGGFCLPQMIFYGLIWSKVGGPTTASEAFRRSCWLVTGSRL